MDSGWGVVLGKGLRQSPESRRVHTRHQIQRMDQESNEQQGSLWAPHLCLAPAPVLAAAAPDGLLIAPLPLLPALLLLNGARSRLDQGHVSVFNKSQSAGRVAPGRPGLALASQQGGMWWMTSLG